MSAGWADDMELCLYNAEIDPVSSDIIPKGFIGISGGKITAVAPGDPPSCGGRLIDCRGMLLCPGFIDAHSHIGLIGDGQSIEGEDVNEDTDPVTPHLRTIDGLRFNDGYFNDAVKAGITCAVTGSGSANPVGGDLIAIKTYGRCADEMLVKKTAIKFALGENPKAVYRDRDETPVTRMACAAIIREALFTAKRYMEDKAAAEDGDAPDFDMKSEALIPLLKGELQAHFHCHRADDIMTAVRIAEEFSLDYVLIHCTEGYLIADILAEKHARAVVGPIIGDRGKPELAGHTVKNAAVLNSHGVDIAICTDCPEVPAEYLAASAAFCVKAGLPYREGLKAITLYPASIVGIADRVGSIEVGKDADIVLLDGKPLDIMTNAVMTLINGRIVHNILQKYN